VLRELAEYPNSYAPLGLHDERIETPRYTLCMGPGASWNTVQRQRFRAEELDEVIAEVRAHLRARGRRSTQWEVGSAADPPALVELLLARGFARDKEPFAAAMVLRRESPPARPGIEARRVRTLEEFLEATRVQRVAFGGPKEGDLTNDRALLEAVWNTSPGMTHAAWLDGALVGAGTSAPTPHGLLLFGGATLPEARGRGVYQALIRARWDEAAGRGTPALFTQAGAMSRPILERLRFEQVGHVHLLVDEFDRGGATP
jgi:GNAT superfamily N-acetyltransferase